MATQPEKVQTMQKHTVGSLMEWLEQIAQMAEERGIDPCDIILAVTVNESWPIRHTIGTEGANLIPQEDGQYLLAIGGGDEAGYGHKDDFYEDATGQLAEMHLVADEDSETDGE